MATKHHITITVPDVAAIAFIALPLILWIVELAQ